MANPRATFSGTVDGVWLLPHTSGGLVTSAQAWIGASSPSTDAVRSVDTYTVSSRAEQISNAGVLHLDTGAIDGLLMDRHGLTADGWLLRLRSLIKDQRLYTVYLASARYYFKVELNGLSQVPTIAGGRAWNVVVPFRELR